MLEIDPGVVKDALAALSPGEIPSSSSVLCVTLAGRAGPLSFSDAFLVPECWYNGSTAGMTVLSGGTLRVVSYGVLG